MNDATRLQAYLDRPLDDLMAELELYDPASRGPADVWRKVAGPVRQRLCVEWDYCTVRQDARWQDDLDLALAVVGVLSSRSPTPTCAASSTACFPPNGAGCACSPGATAGARWTTIWAAARRWRSTCRRSAPGRPSWAAGEGKLSTDFRNGLNGLGPGNS